MLIVLGLTQSVLAPLLGGPAQRHLRLLALPAVAFVLWIVSLYAWHIPPSTRHPARGYP